MYIPKKIFLEKENCNFIKTKKSKKLKHTTDPRRLTFY
jgi:hypothetical protein